MDLEAILDALTKGELSREEALERLRPKAADLGHSRVDHDRSRRCGFPEVLFAEGKEAEDLADIAEEVLRRSKRLLITRAKQEHASAVQARISDAVFEARARCITVQREPEKAATGHVAVLCAGTSDLPVAEEARITAQILGARTSVHYDVGVAGLHRLLSDMDAIRDANVLVVVAGMEGALPSVVGGLVDRPVIAVPTSIGYGASFGGLAALLGMLNSCASGLSVVNIDNGFGAGFQAALINRLAEAND